MQIDKNVKFVTTPFLSQKRKARPAFKREVEISKQLELDDKICSSDNLANIDDILNENDNLKTEIQSIYEEKGRAAIFRSKCRWVEESDQINTSLIWKNKTITRRQLPNFKLMITDRNSKGRG